MRCARHGSVGPRHRAAAAAGGAWTLLTKSTASASASITFTGLDTADYDVFKVVFSAVQPATNGTVLCCRVGNSGGLDTDSTYRYHMQRVTDTSTSYSSMVATTSSYLRLNSEIGNSTGENHSGILHVDKGADAYIKFWGSGTSVTGDPWGVNGNVWGYKNVAITLEQISFYMLSGNIASGDISILGLNKS